MFLEECCHAFLKLGVLVVLLVQACCLLFQYLLFGFLQEGQHFLSFLSEIVEFGSFDGKSLFLPQQYADFVQIRLICFLNLLKMDSLLHSPYLFFQPVHSL